MRKSLSIFILLFTFPFLYSQDNSTYADTVSVDEIDFVAHPIKRQFKYYQNKIVVDKRSKDLAGTFDDPSRVLYRQAGISTNNDQTNAIVYRGLPSNYMQWSINGAPIVNPNHLSNAGSITDISSFSAGGVLGIPFDVINTMTFYGNPYSTNSTSSISGNIDFNFEGSGDNFFKVGLLGMEAGFNTKGKIKTKGHVRYSTVGLLSDFGVDFDGESIKFYDGFLKIDFTDNISATLIRGISSNFKEAVLDLELAEEVKDLKQIDFESNFTIVGIDAKTKNIHHHLYYSRNANDRISFIPNEDFMGGDLPGLNWYDNTIESISYNANTSIDFKSILFEPGLLMQNIEGSSSFNNINRLYLKGRLSTIKPYLNVTKIFDFNPLSIKVSPSAGYYSEINEFEYAFLSQVNFDQLFLDFNYSKKISPSFYNNINSIYSFNENSIVSSSFAIRYNGNDFFTVVRFFQNNVDGDIGPLLPYLPATFLDENSSQYSYIDNNLMLDSKGIEFLIDKSWSSGWYTHFNYTIFDSEYSELSINTPENFKNVFNVIVTKEIETKKNNKWVFNLAYHRRGGGYHIDIEESPNNMNGLSISERPLDAYSRLDGRFQYTWRKKNILTLDIQNLLNTENDGFYFYDDFLEREVLEKQLGMIPILSYKRIL